MSATAKHFSAALRKVIVDENSAIYEQLFSTTQLADVTDAYWKNALMFFAQLDDAQRDVFMSILRQVIVDSVSNVFAILDGVTRLEGPEGEIQLLVGGSRVDGELQDEFLAMEES